MGVVWLCALAGWAAPACVGKRRAEERPVRRLMRSARSASRELVERLCWWPRWGWAGCPRWPSLMAVVESAERDVVVLVGVPLRWVRLLFSRGIQRREGGERGLRHFGWGIGLGGRLREVDQGGMCWLMRHGGLRWSQVGNGNVRQEPMVCAGCETGSESWVCWMQKEWRNGEGSRAAKTRFSSVFL